MKKDLKLSNKPKDIWQDKLFYAINTLFLSAFLLVVLIPLLNILACSFSSANAVVTGKVFIWPVDISLEGYKAVFRHQYIWSAYGNTFLYAGLGTAINLFMTVLAAYPLSRRRFPGKGIVTFMFAFTMLFGAGMVPTYLQISKLGLLNKIWAMVLPGAISTSNMIICRTFFQNIPYEMYEAAEIDGCNDFTYLRAIVLPLSTSVLAVLTLYYVVGHWNAYQNAMLYLVGMEKQPLQTILREILVNSSVNQGMVVTASQQEADLMLAEMLKYSLIIVASVPVLVLYPFIKRFFIKGVMLGSLKG